MLATFGDVYQKPCEHQPDPRERGRQFGALVARVKRIVTVSVDTMRTIRRLAELREAD